MIWFICMDSTWNGSHQCYYIEDEKILIKTTTTKTKITKQIYQTNKQNLGEMTRVNQKHTESQLHYSAEALSTVVAVDNEF